MARYFIELAYDGTDFKGWQRQTQGRTVQGTLEAALSALTGQPVLTAGSGRTDMGVHAAMQVAHIDLPDNLTPAPDWIYRLNALLSKDVCIRRIYPVPPTFHARFSATSRTYHYHLSSAKNPFTPRHCTYLPYSKLDIMAMHQAASYLVGQHNFKTFSKYVPGEHYLCKVAEASWQTDTEDSFLPYSDSVARFTITSNRFLRGQIRAIVGALLQVGKGKRTPAWFKEQLAAQSGQVPAQLAPPQGLCLATVSYPPIEW